MFIIQKHLIENRMCHFTGAEPGRTCSIQSFYSSKRGKLVQIRLISSKSYDIITVQCSNITTSSIIHIAFVI